MGTRQRLLQAADRLFYEHGLTATGVDTISAEAGVAKMTLYHRFGSKDRLIAAYLEARDARWRATLEEAWAHAEDPRGRLLAVVAAYRDRATDDAFRGCPFLNAAAELEDPDHPARAVVRRHKQDVQDTLRVLLAAGGARDPDGVALRAFVLLEGMLAVASVNRDARAVEVAGAESIRVLEAALDG